MWRLSLVSTSEVRNLSEAELDTRIMESKEELLRLRVQHATLQLLDTSQLRQVRRDIARMMTIRRERDLSPVEVRERG